MHLCPRKTRPCFLVAITCLEIGSNAANVCFLTKPGILVSDGRYARLGELWYLVVMTLANVVTTCLTWVWNTLGRECGFHWALRWVPMSVWFVLIYYRQLEAIKVTKFTLS